MHLFHHRMRRDQHPFHAAWGGRLGAFWHRACHRHGHPGGADEHPSGLGDPLQSRAAAFLDLDDRQADHLAHLFGQLHAVRRAAKALVRAPEVTALVETETFQREAAQALFDARVDALKAAGPAAIASFGDFFDALDFEQQQMLRFALRRRTGRGRRDRRGEVDHDA